MISLNVYMLKLYIIMNEVTVNDSKSNIIVAVIYRPPGTNSNDFNIVFRKFDECT